MYWVKRKIRQIQRVIDFFPLIWNGFDFDYKYSIELFRKQLERQAKFLESDRAMTLSAKTDAQKIRTAIKLMDRVYDDYYGMEYQSKIDKLYGTTHYEFVETDELDEDGEVVYKLKLWNENAVDEEHQKEINEVRKKMAIQSKEKHNRAHKLLWDFIGHNIRRWWD